MMMNILLGLKFKPKWINCLQIRFSYLLNVCHLLKADHIYSINRSFKVNEFFQNMFILNYFSNLSFSNFVMIYRFNADLFLIFCVCVIFPKNLVLLIICSFLFYSMVEKCLMTRGQQFLLFWQQAGHLEICYY